MTNIKNIIKTILKMGIGWTVFRATYELKKKTGYLAKKIPAKEFTESKFMKRIIDPDIKGKKDIVDYVKLNKTKYIFSSFDLEDYKSYIKELLDENSISNIIEIANQAIGGKILCFSRWNGEYGSPINWHKNPLSEYEWPRNIHWSKLDELTDKSGDVKYVWEASRFPQVYYFVRAYTLTQDERYPEVFWKQIEHWIEENPVELGINWKCGQEIAFRTFAWIFGLFAFLNSKSTTEERIFTLVKSIYYNAWHIEKNIEFALKSVKNNHAISEAAGLFTVGLLFPIFKESSRWLTKGKKYLEQEGLRQIYSDGSYLQHSMNYHRLVLQVYTWCIRIGQINNIAFSEELVYRLNNSIDFLYQMQDEETGMLPNYGSNDGALVFPLSTCDYLNYKPQLNTLYYLLNGKKLYKDGPHNEELMWFCGIEPLNKLGSSNITRSSKGYEIGGYYVLRNDNSFAMIRCTTYKNRPSHADMLHFDLWYQGKNILTDIGTYSYNPENTFKNYFDVTKNHNTVMINNENQMTKGSRFMMLDWTKGYLEEFTLGKKYNYFSGYHTTYKNYIHRRMIINKSDVYVIIDEIINDKRLATNIKLNWNIGEEMENLENNRLRINGLQKKSLIIEIQSNTMGRLSRYKGNKEIPAGWKSLYYGERIPENQIIYEINTDNSLERIVTILYPEDMKEKLKIDMERAIIGDAVIYFNNK